MKLNGEYTGRRIVKCVQMLAGLALVVMLFAPSASAQSQSTDCKVVEPKSNAETYQTIYLTHVTEQNDVNDVQTALRNMLAKARIYSSQSQKALSIRGTPEDIQLAQKIVADLDRARKTYRLTFTITDTDGGKRVGTQSFTLIAASGEKTVLKQGGRVPVVTGVYDSDNSTHTSQFQYLDVGLTIDATVDSFADGVRLRSKVEQSSLAEEKSGAGTQDPVLHQTTLDGTSTLVLGKPLVLGSLDVPGSTRKQEVAVVSELVR